MLVIQAPMSAAQRRARQAEGDAKLRMRGRSVRFGLAQRPVRWT